MRVPRGASGAIAPFGRQQHVQATVIMKQCDDNQCKLKYTKPGIWRLGMRRLVALLALFFNISFFTLSCKASCALVSNLCALRSK